MVCCYRPKALSLTSLDDTATLDVRAAGTEKPAQLRISGDDQTIVSVYGGSHEDVKLKLEDNFNRQGYVFTRGDGAGNKLELERMYAGQGTVSCLRTSQWVTASADNLFNAINVELGDAVTLTVDGLEETRTVIQIDPNGGAADRLKVSSMFTGQTDILNSAYQIAKRVMTVESDDVVVFGGARGKDNSGTKELVLRAIPTATYLDYA